MKKFLPLIVIVLTGILFSLNSCKQKEEPIPVAAYNYSYTQECNIPTEVNFENFSIDATIYRWNFGDGSPIVYEKNPKHIYQHEGIYSVELTAYGNGGMHEQVKAIYIVASPIIDFTVNDTLINVNDSVHFTGIALSGVLPSAWFWNFGDGTTSNEQNPTHTYFIPGIFDVTLTAVNACGSTYIEKKKYINVNSLGSPPLPDFVANFTNITTGQSVNFTDLSVNNPTNWNWSFQGGTPAVSNLQHPSNILFNAPGTYSVTLTTTNISGSNSITKIAYIHVLNASPTMVFIKKITVKQMGFPQMSTVNLFYKIKDGTSSTIYLNGINQIIPNVSQSSLPVFWNINPMFQVPSINYLYRIELWDKKIMPSVENLAGSIPFNIFNFTNGGTSYPIVINLIQTPFNIELELQWQ